MSGDDHARRRRRRHGERFDRYKAASPAGCSVAHWQCVRSTSYIYPAAPLTNAQAAGIHRRRLRGGAASAGRRLPTRRWLAGDAGRAASTRSSTQFQREVHRASRPRSSSRTHCVTWPDWASGAEGRARPRDPDGHELLPLPRRWIGAKPGFMTGGGFPMRFADLDGTLIDVYQAEHEHDRRGRPGVSGDRRRAARQRARPERLLRLLRRQHPQRQPGTAAGRRGDRRLGPGARRADDLRQAAAQWTDGRNASTIRGLNWSGGTFTFVTTVGAGANGLQTMLPMQGPTGTLSALTCGGSPRPYTVQTIKGIQYAMFDTVTGTCHATYW